MSIVLVNPSGEDPSAMAEKATIFDKFLISRGGPFYELQRQLQLLREDANQARSRALLFVCLAWGGPLILSGFAGHAWGPFAERPYLVSLTPLARFLVAVGVFVLMERSVETRLRLLITHFERAPILARKSFEVATESVSNALKNRDARSAEAVCLALAIAVSIVLRDRLLILESSTWAVRVADDGNVLTLAGWWCVLVSNPLFSFLLLRWLWRVHVWSKLLRRIAELDLRLVATHPDGHGGLMFIGRYPNVFTLFVFALSCSLGAAVANELLDKAISTTAYGYVMAGWLAIVLGLFTYPLLAFRKPLADLKTKTLIASSAQATEYFRCKERGTLGTNVVEVAVITLSVPAQ